MAATERAIELAVAAARAASDLKAEEIIALDVSEQLVLTDVFLIASGTNERQVGAIVDAVEESLLKLGAKPIRREGKAPAAGCSSTSATSSCTSSTRRTGCTTRSSGCGRTAP